MEKFRRELERFSRIALDTSIFIYHFEAHALYHPLTEEIFRGVESGVWKAVTSTITLIELTVQPYQLHRPDIAQKYEALLANFPNLTIQDIHRDVARQAAQIRAQYGLRVPDAIQVATGLYAGAEAFVSNDMHFKPLAQLTNILILDEYRSPHR